MKNKCKQLSLCLLLLFWSGYAQAQKLEWAKSMGGTTNDRANAVAVDATGNVYTAGFFTGTADFDPSAAGVSNLTSAGGNDIFVSKLDATGNFVWAKSMGGTGNDTSVGIAVDATGNIYITGGFEGTVDFDPNATAFNLTSAGQFDIFISKLNATGNFVWAKSMGSTSFDFGRSIAVDATGNVYTTGEFQLTVDFDPSTATISNLTSAGLGDIFVSKLNTNGDFIWAKNMGGTTNDFGRAIAVDATGNVYTAGRFTGTADFDPNIATSNLTSAGQVDIFVSKLNASGSIMWAKRMGGTDFDEASSLTVDLLAMSILQDIFRLLQILTQTQEFLT